MNMWPHSTPCTLDTLIEYYFVVFITCYNLVEVSDPRILPPQPNPLQTSYVTQLTS